MISDREVLGEGGGKVQMAEREGDAKVTQLRSPNLEKMGWNEQSSLEVSQGAD